MSFIKSEDIQSPLSHVTNNMRSYSLMKKNGIKIKEFHRKTQEEDPHCTNCDQKFLALVTTKINNKMEMLCFGCYEQVYGKHTLQRITMGTPKDKLAEMRKPIQ